jgi:DNA-binding NarL/FixJ family response regulator
LKGGSRREKIRFLPSNERETPLRPEKSTLKQARLDVPEKRSGGEDLPISRRNGDAMSSVSVAPRVLIAESDSATRTGIRLALEGAGIEVCGEVEGTAELVDAVARFEPDVCLVDVSLAGGGMSAAAEICVREPTPAVVILADALDEEEFLLAMRIGAVGYLPMSISGARLPAVVRAVLVGELAIPRGLVPMLIHRLRERGTRRHVRVPHRRAVDLTSREWEVLDLMRDGLSTREIAGRLVISDVTVRRHIGAVLKKLQVQSRAEALELLQSA